MRIITAILIITAIFTGCRKSEIKVNHSGYIKSLPCDSNMITVGHVRFDDQSAIIVSRSLDGSTPGYMFKTDGNGNFIWKKRLNPRAKGCYQVYDLKNNQFAVIGYENTTDTYFTLYTYDRDGNQLFSKSIPFNYFINIFSVRELCAVQMQKLSNGNYVFAYGGGRLALCFTNSAFDTLFYKNIKIGNSKYIGGFVRGIYQNSDSTILFSNATAISTPSAIKEYDVHLIKTNIRGDSLSSIFISDSTHSETPNLMVPLGENILLVTGRMGEINKSFGAWVKYLNNDVTRQISGEINLVQLNRNGSYIKRQSIRDYPANGMIMSGSPTVDGGYILCGTVNQSDAINIISPTKIYLLKVSAAGLFEWSRTFATAYPSFGIDVSQTSDGGYFISGYEKKYDKFFNPIIIKTDANGNL